jgi:hypothetical protein
MANVITVVWHCDGRFNERRGSMSECQNQFDQCKAKHYAVAIVADGAVLTQFVGPGFKATFEAHLANVVATTMPPPAAPVPACSRLFTLYPCRLRRRRALKTAAPVAFHQAFNAPAPAYTSAPPVTALAPYSAPTPMPNEIWRSNQLRSALQTAAINSAPAQAATGAPLDNCLNAVVHCARVTLPTAMHRAVHITINVNTTIQPAVHMGGGRRHGFPAAANQPLAVPTLQPPYPHFSLAYTGPWPQATLQWPGETTEGAFLRSEEGRVDFKRAVAKEFSAAGFAQAQVSVPQNQPSLLQIDIELKW